MLIRALVFAVSLLIGCWTSTVWLVLKLGAKAIPLTEGFSFLGVRIFPPWLWLKWYWLYGGRFQGIFFASMWPIYASIGIGISLSWFLKFWSEKKFPSIAHGSARWAKENEFAEAGLISEHGVVLGRSKESNRILCHNGPEHIIAVAPTRSGKGVGLVVPTLLNWSESAVIFDPKGENWHITSGYRAKLGKCLLFDPTSHETVRFNPLMEIRKGDLEVKDAQNIADIIVDPDGRLESRNHWQNAAHSLLMGSILYVLFHYTKKSLSGVIEFLTRPGVDFVNTLDEMAKSNHPVIMSVAQEMLNKHIEERSGVLSTALSLLAIFRDPLVAHATDHHDFSVSSLRSDNQTTSLYLVLPPSDLSRLRVLLRIMLNQIGRFLTEQHKIGDTKNRKILFLLDEFPSLGRLEFFESALAYMAGYGLKAFLICQSLNQLQKIYGERNAILDNCHVRVFFANNDDQTARRVSDLMGEQTLIKEQTSVSGSRYAMIKPSSSTANIEFGRALLLASEINRLPSHQEIILINGFFPILAQKIRYFDDDKFSNKILPHFLLKNTPTKSLQNKAVSDDLAEKLPTPKTIGSAL